MPTTYSSKRLTKWQVIAIAGAIVGLIILTVVMPLIAQQRTRSTYADLAGARFDAPDLLAKIGAPPGAEEAGFRTVEGGPTKRSFKDAGKASLSWSHTHEVDLTFEQVIAWYSPRLLADGWKVHEPATAAGAVFCKAPWLLKISPGAAPNKATAGSSRFDLRLEWSNQFIEGTCQHP